MQENTDKQTQYKSEKADNLKYSRTELTWFSCLLQHSARKRGGLILHRPRAHTVCKSARRSRQITTPATHHSVFTGRMPFLPPNQQRQSTTYFIQWFSLCTLRTHFVTTVLQVGLVSQKRAFGHNLQSFWLRYIGLHFWVLIWISAKLCVSNLTH